MHVHVIPIFDLPCKRITINVLYRLSQKGKASESEQKEKKSQRVNLSFLSFVVLLSRSRAPQSRLFFFNGTDNNANDDYRCKTQDGISIKRFFWALQLHAVRLATRVSVID